jgi:replication fork protection complex subunit Tof1/Swi1
MEKRATIKSAARIIDSDDDEDADAEFFRKERELRHRMERKALEGSLPSNGTRKVTTKNRSEKRREVLESESGGDGVDGEIEIVAIEEHSPSMAMEEVHDNQSDNEDKDGVRVAKKRKVRRAVSTSSDEG